MEGKPIPLPSAVTAAALNAHLRAHYAATGVVLDYADANVVPVWCADAYWLRVVWPDGPAWMLPIDPETSAFMESLSSPKH